LNFALGHGAEFIRLASLLAMLRRRSLHEPYKYYGLYSHGRFEPVRQLGGTSFAILDFGGCKEFLRRATHLQNRNTMITIRSCNSSSEVALICVEATLTTPRGVFKFLQTAR
jgi:hypothetical protein